MFSCANWEMVIGEVVGIELGNAAFQFENSGIAGANEFYFVSNSLLEVDDTSLQSFDGFILGGKSGIDCTAVVNHRCGWCLLRFFFQRELLTTTIEKVGIEIKSGA